MSATSDGLVCVYDENRITTYLLSQTRGQHNRGLPSEMRTESNFV